MEKECYEEEVEPYRKTDYTAIIIIECEISKLKRLFIH